MKPGPETEAALYRAWVQQLYQEHRTVCWQHRIDLPRPLIELAAGQSIWGSWEPRSRAIRIATRLVTEHSWDVVVNVLKHEMAHQIVTTLLKGDDGHGPLFARACDMIGVPEAFRSASGDIPRALEPACPQGSREQQMLAKVRKLLALAESANEHEAGLAMEKANELIGRYNLERVSEQRQASYDYRIINHRAKRIERHQRRISNILSDHFFVEVIFSYLYDPRRDETHRTIELLGTAENVTIAEYVYFFLLNQLDLLWDAYRRKSGAAGRSKRSYRLGILDGFDEKLERQKSKSDSYALTQALVLIECDPGLEAFKAARFPRIKMRRHGMARPEELAFTAGLEEGRKLTLHKGMHDHDGNRGRLLGE